MKATEYSTTLLVNKTPEEVYHCINNVRGWWSEEIEGNTDIIHEEFTYHYKDVHFCHLKISETIPDKKVVWTVLDNFFGFTRDKNEWKNTKIIFEIFAGDGLTELRFTHHGLTPSYECFEVCVEGWNNYIKNSLYKLIITGKGEPNPKEGIGFNALLAEKWKLE